MTMHMVGPYLTTTSYRKREERITQRQREQCVENHARWHVNDPCRHRKRPDRDRG